MEERYFFLQEFTHPCQLGAEVTLVKDRGAITYVIGQLFLKEAEVVMQAIRKLFLKGARAPFLERKII